MLEFPLHKRITGVFPNKNKTKLSKQTKIPSVYPNLLFQKPGKVRQGKKINLLRSY
jgi:hypothetical protein